MSNLVIPTTFSAIDKISPQMVIMEKSVSNFAKKSEKSFSSMNDKLKDVGSKASNIAQKSFIAGAAIAAPLILAGNEAIKFEDKMADVAKTTGLAGNDLNDFGKNILDLSTKTRTSVDDLVSIAEIGGQFGVAKNELLAFTESANKFNVALGKDFGGVEEAVSSVTAIKNVFKETRGSAVTVAQSLDKIGSAINELGAQGAGTSQNIADFSKRIGGLPDNIKPSLQSTLALAAYFEEMGLKSEVASGGFSNLLLVGGKNIGGFAAQMKLSTKEASKLLQNDPTAFAQKFATSFKGMSAVQLSETLKKLGIGTQETIKVIGALGGDTKRLTELQNISNQSFKEGTSLSAEYDKKNQTSAANIAKFKNQVQALAVVIGQELIPVFTKIMAKVTPFFQSIFKFAKENPKTVKTILGLVAGVAGLLFLLSGFATVVSIITGAIVAWTTVTKAFTAAQLFLNTALFANPIGLIVLGILALIAVVVIIIKYWDEWGAAMSLLLGPLGFVISLIQSFRKNWDMITKAFSDGGVLEGFKAIGAVILDAILYPIQQVMELIAKFTGLDFASTAAKSLQNFRAELGVDVGANEQAKPVVNTAATKQESFNETIRTNNNNSTLTIKDLTGRGQLQGENNNISMMPKLGSSLGF